MLTGLPENVALANPISVYEEVAVEAPVSWANPVQIAVREDNPHWFPIRGFLDMFRPQEAWEVRYNKIDITQGGSSTDPRNPTSNPTPPPTPARTPPVQTPPRP